jgi:hypothetical protein
MLECSQEIEFMEKLLQENQPNTRNGIQRRGLNSFSKLVYYLCAFSNNTGAILMSSKRYMKAETSFKKAAEFRRFSVIQLGESSRVRCLTESSR